MWGCSTYLFSKSWLNKVCLVKAMEKAMAPHSSTLAWKIPWTGEPGGLQSMWSRRVGHDWATSLSLSCIGEGNGNPLQCSCLENPRDGGAWWAAVYGVAQSLTRLKRLSSSSSQSYGEGNGTPLQYSCLENPMDGGAWKAAVHGVTEGRTRLSDFTFTFHLPALEKEMATHSSVLAWRIPGTGEPGGLPSMGSHRVGHDWSDLVVVVVMVHLMSTRIRNENVLGNTGKV